MSRVDYCMGVAQEIEDYKANHSEAEVKEFNTRTAPEEFLKTATDLIGPYYEAREANEKKVEDLKAFFRSQKKVAGKTKAGSARGGHGAERCSCVVVVLFARRTSSRRSSRSCPSTPTRRCRPWMRRCSPTWPRSLPSSRVSGSLSNWPSFQFSEKVKC